MHLGAVLIVEGPKRLAFRRSQQHGGGHDVAPVLTYLSAKHLDGGCEVGEFLIHDGWRLVSKTDPRPHQCEGGHCPKQPYGTDGRERGRRSHTSKIGHWKVSLCRCPIETVAGETVYATKGTFVSAHPAELNRPWTVGRSRAPSPRGSTSESPHPRHRSAAPVTKPNQQENLTKHSDVPRRLAMPTAKKPNILIIWGDDIGISNLSCYSHGLMGYRTPNIDRIAREGIMFTDSYGEQSCTAGRSSFITGQSVYRTGLSKVGIPGAPTGMSEKLVTIAACLKNQGYATGQFGKNHLGDLNHMLPTNHGFDEFFGNLYHLNAEEEPEMADYLGFHYHPNLIPSSGLGS